jgi:three-Cys-motif partner protein
MLDDDGLPLDEVGAWAKEKHERLRKYVDISRGPRRKWVQGRGGATLIDLYCGTGRAIIRDTREKIDGSPLVAFKSARDGGVPFSEIHIADASEEKCRAAEQRIVKAGGSAIVEFGNAEDTVVRIASKLNPYGLHFSFLDPYNLEDLPFSVIEALAKFKHIDILVHVSAHDLQRNLDAYSKDADGPLDLFAPGWRTAVNLKQSQPATRAAYIAYWTSKMEVLGFPPARYELVSGTTKNQRLYWLVLVSHHKLAKDFWDKIRIVSGQGELCL